MMGNDIKRIIEHFWKMKAGDLVAGQKTEGVDSPVISHRLGNITIAICNQKGGCSKTTTAINVSACLAQKGQKVLLVDLDPQAHASLGLGVDVHRLDRSIYDVLVQTIPLEAVLQKTSVDGLYIIPACSRLAGAQLELNTIPEREAALKIALGNLKRTQTFDFIVFDCSPSLNLVTLNALVASKYVMIPVQTHYYSLEGMMDLFATIDNVKERLNSEIKILGILATLFDGRLKISHQILDRIRNYFDGIVFETVIHYNVKLCEAPLHKKPVNLYAPKSQGAKDYEKLTDEIIRLTSEPDKNDHREEHLVSEGLSRAV